VGADEGTADRSFGSAMKFATTPFLAVGHARCARKCAVPGGRRSEIGDIFPATQSGGIDWTSLFGHIVSPSCDRFDN